MTRRARRAFRNTKVDVKGLRLPTFFVDPRDNYVRRLLLIRTVLIRVGPDQLNTALWVLFELCRNEYLRRRPVLTHEAIQEVVTATTNLAFSLQLPKIAVTKVKNRLSAEIKWWNAWVDEEAGLGLADRVAPVTVASQSGQPHWLDVELEKLDVTLNALNKTHQGPESRTTKTILRNESIEETSGIKIFKALKRAGSDIDRKTFDERIALQIKRPKSSGH